MNPLATLRVVTSASGVNKTTCADTSSKVCRSMNAPRLIALASEPVHPATDFGAEGRRLPRPSRMSAASDMRFHGGGDLDESDLHSAGHFRSVPSLSRAA